MALLQVPDPISIYEGAKNAGLERETADALVSSTLSGWLSFLWTFGTRSLLGLGPALQDMATAEYLTLSKIEKKGFLTLTVPTKMLASENLSRFETEQKKK